MRQHQLVPRRPGRDALGEGAQRAPRLQPRALEQRLDGGCAAPVVALLTGCVQHRRGNLSGAKRRERRRQPCHQGRVRDTSLALDRLRPQRGRLLGRGYGRLERDHWDRLRNRRLPPRPTVEIDVLAVARRPPE